MTRLLEWLLDLKDIRLARDAPLILKWENAVPAWVLFCAGIAVLTWIAWSCRRERTTLPRRTLLGLLRFALLTLVVAILCRPSLVVQHNRVEPSHVVVLLDTSLSMAAKDRYPDATLAGEVAAGAGLAGPAALVDHSRLELVAAALTRGESGPLRRLLDHNGLQLATFSRTLETRASADSAGSLAGVVDGIRSAVADGASTDLPGAITQVLDKAQGRRLAAVVLASDGQSTQASSLKDALDLAAGRQIPIYPLRIGSTEAPRDVEVGPLRAQESVFVNDVLAVEARLTARGLTEPTSTGVQLIDERSGTVAASETVVLDPGGGPTAVELRTKPTRTGDVRYRVEAAALAHEQNLDNNADRIDVRVVDDRLRVLYVEGYPRFEYRYLKNALLREKTVELSVLLLEADEQFVQEGTEPIRRFPETPEELNRYDVVLFGDVDPRGGWLTLAQMNMMLDFVGHEGGGFGLLAGERFAPHRFLGTPLERLIPVAIDPQFLGRYEAPLATGYQPQLTPEGRVSRIFRFTADRAESEALFESLPDLYWVARTLGPKPGAAVLAEHPTLRTAAGAMPVVVSGRYGAGKLFFQATDDTWRWRRHTGELLHDAYWIQVARELMRGSRAAQDRRYMIRTDRRVYAYGAPVQVQIEVLDPQLMGELREAVTVQAVESAVSAAEAGTTVPPAGAGAISAEFEAQRLSPDSPLFEGAFVPPHPGGFAIVATDVPVRPGDRAASVLIRVDRPDLEARRPEADHETLERIASATGGRVVNLDQLDTEFAAIRDRSVRIPDDITEPLWDSKLVLTLFVLMISTEWVLRKAFGLL